MKTYTTSTYLRAKEAARTQELCEILQRALEVAAEDEDRVTLKLIQGVVLKAWSESAAVMVCSNVCRGRR